MTKSFGAATIARQFPSSFVVVIRCADQVAPISDCNGWGAGPASVSVFANRASAAEFVKRTAHVVLPNARIEPMSTQAWARACAN